MERWLEVQWPRFRGKHILPQFITADRTVKDGSTCSTYLVVSLLFLSSLVSLLFLKMIRHCVTSMRIDVLIGSEDLSLLLDYVFSASAWQKVESQRKAGLLLVRLLLLFPSYTSVSKNQQLTSDVPTLLVISILLLVAFGFWERHLERNTTFPPIAKFSLFTRHNYKVTIIIISTFFITMSVYGYVYLATIWYQTHMGMTALQSAIRMLPCMIAGTIAAVCLSRSAGES